MGWLFVGPFGIVFLAFLIAPLAYALYLSLFQKKLIGGTSFVLFDNYVKAFTDPSFLSGSWFVIRFSLVSIPLQIIIALAMALILDSVTTLFARFSRLMIFLPYAIPTVIGAVMWGFLYSRGFGPLTDIFGLFGATAPDFLSSDLIFYGLLNVVTWQWAGYYMIILYAALQGDRPDALRGGPDGRRRAVADRDADQDPADRARPDPDPGLLAHRHPAVLQRTADPAVPRRGHDRPDFTPNMYAYQQAFSLANFNYGSAISFALGGVVFICVYAFLFFTRKRRSFL